MSDRGPANLADGFAVGVLLAERDQLRARVEVLAEALTTMASQHRHYVEGYCEQDDDLDTADEWCYPCIARAALAAGTAPTEGGEQRGE